MLAAACRRAASLTGDLRQLHRRRRQRAHDFEDPACCPTARSFTMLVRKLLLKPRGAAAPVSA
jgi:hypothetical protein